MEKRLLFYSDGNFFFAVKYKTETVANELVNLAKEMFKQSLESVF